MNSTKTALYGKSAAKVDWNWSKKRLARARSVFKRFNDVNVNVVHARTRYWHERIDILHEEAPYVFLRVRVKSKETGQLYHNEKRKRENLTIKVMTSKSLIYNMSTSTAKLQDRFANMNKQGESSKVGGALSLIVTRDANISIDC